MPCQQNTIAEIELALKDGKRVFIIRGAAGTGKTTLVKQLVPMIRRMGLNPCLMAPTGRAALVLGERTGTPASTIHSGIFNVGDRPIMDESGLALKWHFPLKKDQDIENVAFIIDESSMVGCAKHDNDRELLQFGTGSLLNDLVEYSGIKTSDTTNVLFFVGDSFQLPPVEERCDVPPALDPQKLFELTNLQPCVVELTDVHRQGEGSGILTEANKLRDALVRSDFNFLRFEDHPDVSFETTENAFENWRDLNSLDDKIIIAQTNARVREYNDQIRAILHITDTMPTAGERLLSIRNTRVGNCGMLSQVYNGDFLRVQEVSAAPSIKIDGFYKPKDSDKAYSFTYMFKKISFSWVYEPKRGKVQDVWVNVTPILYPEWDDFPNYAAIGLYNAVRDNIESELRKEFPDYRIDRRRKDYWDGILRKRIQDSPFLHAPIVKFGYAVTGHKSQGGEWDNVWGDYAYGSNIQTGYFFRWAYTVTTRAKAHLHILNAPSIDSVGNAFLSAVGVGGGVSKSGEVQNENCAECLSFRDRFEADGYKVEKIEELSYRYRVFVSAKESPKCGWIDFIYNRKDRISSIDTHVDSCPEWISGLKGMPRKYIVSESSSVASVESVSLPELSIESETKRKIVERVKEGIESCGFQLLSVIELTQYQIRLNVDKASTNGYVDLYFDGKERLTNKESNLPPNDMSAVTKGITDGR